MHPGISFIASQREGKKLIIHSNVTKAKESSQCHSKLDIIQISTIYILKVFNFLLFQPFIHYMFNAYTIPAENN